MDFADSRRYRVPLLVDRTQDGFAELFALHGPVRRNAYDREPIDRCEFAGDFLRRPGHAREAEVAAEEALVADPGPRILATRERHAFLDFDHLM